MFCKCTVDNNTNSYYATNDKSATGHKNTPLFVCFLFVFRFKVASRGRVTANHMSGSSSFTSSAPLAIVHWCRWRECCSGRCEVVAFCMCKSPGRIKTVAVCLPNNSQAHIHAQMTKAHLGKVGCRKRESWMRRVRCNGDCSEV